MRDGALMVNSECLDKHPDFKRCYQSLVTNLMSNKEFIKSNRDHFACTLSKSRQPPNLVKQARKLPRKKRAYHARLFCQRIEETNYHFGGLDWECPSAEDLLKSSFVRFVHMGCD